MSHDTIALPARLDISAAGALYDDIRGAFDSGAPCLHVDSSATEMATTPALQLLLCAFNSAASRDLPRSLTPAASSAFDRALAELGLTQHFTPFKDTP